MKRRLFNLLAILSVISFIAVCVLWVRSRTRSDHLSWMYCRYLPDKSITSDEAHLKSDRYGVELNLSHGHVPPRSPDNVRGYDVNADDSHGRPTVWFYSQPYDPLDDWLYLHAPGMQRHSPIGLHISHIQQPKDPAVAEGRSVTLVMSHWLLAILLPVMPTWWLKRCRRTRRAGRRGMCAKCGYDLPATPQRCPECGTASRAL